MSTDKPVKILFRFHSNILDEITVETLWADVIDEKLGYYKLDNIPFYAPLIALGDIVHAEYDESEGMLTYRSTIEYSGNSTIHVIIMDDGYDINAIRKVFEDMGCLSERMKNRYFAMEVPFNVDYLPIKQKLMKMAGEEIIDFAETSLSDNHYHE